MSFPTIYIDRFGSVDTEIVMNGKQLNLTVDRVKFVGNSFDDFIAIDILSKNSRFAFNSEKELTDCQIVSKIPLVLIYNNREIQSILEINLTLNSSTYSTTIFSLEYEEVKIITKPVYDFESGLKIIMNELPNEYKLKCCFGCTYSDYSVYGNGLYGSMLCFKNIKEKYLKIKDKDDYLEIMDNYDSNITETYLCDEFQSRPKKIGYRG